MVRLGFDIPTGGGLLVLAVAGSLLAGCGVNDNGGNQVGNLQGASAASPALPDNAQSLVDQGNTAQRAGQYADALSFYQEAMALAPEHAVPQFGALMAAMAIGDSISAESLRERLEENGPDLLSMLEPGGAMQGGTANQPSDPHTVPGELPPGHPATGVAPFDTLLF